MLAVFVLCFTIQLMYQGKDMLQLKAPTSNSPQKYARTLATAIFTTEELEDSITYQSSKSGWKPLDQDKVQIMFSKL